MSDDRKRELGIIRKVFIGKEDHGIPTVNVDIEFPGSCHQGFGNLCMDHKTQAKYVRMLCETFGVENPDDLVGKKCMALRNFGEWNEYIEGLETLGGNRFTHTDFRYVVQGHKETPLAKEKKNIEQDIAHHENRIRELKARAKTIDQRYTPWSNLELKGKANDGKKASNAGRRRAVARPSSKRVDRRAR